jgi:hypothetical protein
MTRRSVQWQSSTRGIGYMDITLRVVECKAAYSIPITCPLLFPFYRLRRLPANLCRCGQNMVRLLSFLLGISCLFKASIAQSSSDESTDSDSSVCTPTTGLYAIYTSDSSTYLIQDAPRTGQAAPSCPAEATSTVLEISTVWQTNDVSTVYRSSTYYVSNLSTIACGSSSSSINGSLDCPPPATITIPAALPLGGINQTSVSTVFQEASCPSDASIPVTVTSLLSNNQPCPTCSSQSGADLYTWLLSNQSLSVSCSTIANISAAVTTTIFGTPVSSIIYGSAVCPIVFHSSPRTGFAASGLTTESSSPVSISTIYQNASCQTVSTLPPVTTSVYLSNLNCTKSTVFSTIFESGSTEIISTIPPLTTSIYLPNLNCSGSTVFSTVFQNGSADSSTVFKSSCPVCPSLSFPGSTVFSTVFASGPAGIFPTYNSSCPACPSSICSGSTVVSTIFTSGSIGSFPACNSSCSACPSSICSGSTIFSTIFASGSAGSFPTYNSSCPACPSLTFSGSTVFSTIFESGSAGSPSYPNSSCPTCPTGGLTTVFADSASCTAPMNASTITLSQSFVSTVFTQNPACNSMNTSTSMDMYSLISATRYTTIYGPDVTVTMPGQSFTTMDSDAYCETCPDACYVDFNDDGIPDAQENMTSSATPSATGSNSTVVAPAPTPVVIADNNFENGTGNSLNSSTSSPAVTAQIVQSNDSSAPLTAQSGNSYL